MFEGYENVELIGEGGLGKVFRARRSSTGGEVAIKELREDAGGSLSSHRIRRELDALLKVKGHPNVISVEEVLEGPNGPCLVMEYAPGGSLLDRMTQRPFSTPEIVLIGQQVTAALTAAHSVGIIHRDIKPHNLLVGAFGQVKVCDFGIASLVSEGGSGTMTNALTLAYASPEEVDGGDVGPAADVYSFGATMLHVITGRKPAFRDRVDGPTADFGAIDPALTGVVSVLRYTLAHEPADRPTMQYLQDAFDEAAAKLGAARVRGIATGAETIAVGSASTPEVIQSVPDFSAKPSPTNELDAELTVARQAPALFAPPVPVQVPVVVEAELTQSQDAATVMRASSSHIPSEVVPDPGPHRRSLLPLFGVFAVLALLSGTAFALSRSGDDPSTANTTTVDVASTTGSVDDVETSVAEETLPNTTISSTTQPSTTQPSTTQPSTAQPATTAAAVPPPTTARPSTPTTRPPTTTPATAPPPPPPPTTVTVPKKVTISLVGPFSEPAIGCNNDCYWIVGSLSGFSGSTVVVNVYSGWGQDLQETVGSTGWGTGWMYLQGSPGAGPVYAVVEGVYSSNKYLPS